MLVPVLGVCDNKAEALIAFLKSHLDSEPCLASGVGEGGGPLLTALESPALLSGTLVLRQPQASAVGPMDQMAGM